MEANPTTETSTESPPVPWISRHAYMIVNRTFFLTQILLAYTVFREWWVVSIVLVLFLSHLMHALLVSFHEASHGLLRKHRFANEYDGTLLGILTLVPFTLYRNLHQKHHLHLATEKDVELWPFVHPDSPRWKRRLVAFLELNFGLFFTPYLFLRVFLQKGSPVSSAKVRRRIWKEIIACVAFWTLSLVTVATFDLWPWFFFNYFIPAFVAGNLQSWRKYIEHVGLQGSTPRSATRSIIADSWSGRLVSLTLLHEPLHGIHHVKMALPHYDLPPLTGLLEPTEEGDTTPYPNYRSAFVDLIAELRDPKVGSQWNSVDAPTDRPSLAHNLAR